MQTEKRMDCPKYYYVHKKIVDAKTTDVVNIIGKAFTNLEDAEKWVFDIMVADSSEMTDFFIRYDTKHGDFILSDESKHTITSFKIEYK